MKTLLIIRHANSRNASLGQADFDRPLSDSGKEEAEKMAGRVAGQINSIDLFIASAARRTTKTAKIFMKVYKAENDLLQSEPGLYESSLEAYYKVLENVPDDKHVVAIFGHNPGITCFTNSLAAGKVSDMPTGSVFALTFGEDKWFNLRKVVSKQLFFYYPGEE